jgi:peptidoglycan/LPS O-acetylase OafA/YrhL
MNRLTHVDGLRAIAVLAVLFYHLGITNFSGGFVGVDVFFVISGFVISRMILRELDEDKFSFTAFYRNRFNRLYPALMFTILACLAAGVLILPPSLLIDLSRSSFASVTAWSNIYFWTAAGYFDKAAELKPLLHTWTLSLEWQFYAIWPLILWATPRRFLPISITALSIASAVLCALWWLDPTSPFFWMPFRIFEFGMGAMVLWLPRATRWTAEVSTIAGLAMVAASVFLFTEQTPFPSYYALLPALGATLVIWGGAGGIGAILRISPITFLGRCSYSVYLVHWPLIAFVVCYTAQPLSTNAAAAIGLISLLGGAALYRWIEEPFWHGRLAKRAWSIAPQWAAATVVLCGFATTGLWWRVPVERRIEAVNSTQYHITHFGGAGYKANRLVHLGANGAPVSFHIMGDSYAHQLLSGLDRELKIRKMAADAFVDNGCPMLIGTTRVVGGVEDKSCSVSISSATGAFRNDGRPILFALNWLGYKRRIGDENGAQVSFRSNNDYFAFLTNHFARTKRAMGDPKFILYGEPPRPSIAELTPFECLTSPGFFSRPCASTLAGKRATISVTDVLYHNTLITSPITVLDPASYLCDEQSCPVFQNGNLIYSDGAHLSLFGSSLVAPHLLSDVLTAIR